METRRNMFFFLRPKWIAWGGMISGGVISGYGFFNVLRYAEFGQIRPLFFGTDAMAFSTACLFVLCGLTIFWYGWLIREDTFVKAKSTVLTSTQLFQLGLAFLSSLTLIIVALIAMFKR